MINKNCYKCYCYYRYAGMTLTLRNNGKDGNDFCSYWSRFIVQGIIRMVLLTYYVIAAQGREEATNHARTMPLDRFQIPGRSHMGTSKG